MTYTFGIGEAVINSDIPNLGITIWIKDERGTRKVVGDDGTNKIGFGYGYAATFASENDLEELFFGDGFHGNCRYGYHREQSLLSEHPGAAILCQADVDEFKSALDKHISRYGDIEPGFTEHGAKDRKSNSRDCADRARLIWFHYWADWAVKNCKVPVFVNS